MKDLNALHSNHHPKTQKQDHHHQLPAAASGNKGDHPATVDRRARFITIFSSQGHRSKRTEPANSATGPSNSKGNSHDSGPIGTEGTEAVDICPACKGRMPLKQNHRKTPDTVPASPTVTTIATTTTTTTNSTPCPRATPMKHSQPEYNGSKRQTPSQNASSGSLLYNVPPTSSDTRTKSRVREWLELKKYQYDVTTSLYMLDTWERVLFNSLLFLGFSLTIYTIYAYLPEWKQDWYTRSSRYWQ